MAKDLSPEELDLLNKGDVGIFIMVWLAYEEALYAFILNKIRDITLAEDLLSETKVAFFSGKQTFAENAHVRNYLYLAAKHRISDFYKTRKKDFPLEDISDPPDYVADEETLEPFEPLEGESKREYAREIFSLAIRDMSHLQKEIFRLYLDGKQPRETAEILGIKAKQVSDHLDRIKKTIIAFIEKNKDHPLIRILGSSLLNFF